MGYSKNYTNKDWEVVGLYLQHISYALLNETIPSLREVIMEWDSQKNTICFYFYHDGPITETVEKHYGFINSLAHCPDLEVKTNYKIVRMDYPANIPQREFTIYARKEPFVDPVDDSPPPKGEAAFYRESYKRGKPLPQDIEYSENDWKIIQDFRGYISRALWSEVIPSLRQVSMRWDPEEKIMWILFYHDGPITDAIAEQYGYIDSLADCYPSLSVQSCYKMMRLDYPEALPKNCFVVYARKEPFVDP